MEGGTQAALLARVVGASPLRNRVFHSLFEADLAIAKHRPWLNDRKKKGVDGSSRELFESYDLPALKPLLWRPYELASWNKVRISIEYHIDLDGNYHSVPHRLTGEKVDVRLADAAVEVFRKLTLIASHPRSFAKGSATTHDRRQASHKACLK